MKVTRRTKRWLFWATAVGTLSVILWSAFVFTVFWLRIGCVRELAASAETLDEVRVNEKTINAGQPVPVDYYSELRLSAFGLEATDADGVLTRLEELQQPSVGVLFRRLLRLRNRPQSISDSIYLGALLLDQATETEIGSDADELGDPIIVAAEFEDTAKSFPIRKLQTSVLYTNYLVGLSSTHCYSVLGTRGEKYFVVQRPREQPQTAESAEHASTESELVLIDQSGRILSRSPMFGETVLGKLREPFEGADQLLFGSSDALIAKHVGRVFGPGAVVIVEHGQWKVIRKIDAPAEKQQDDPDQSPRDDE